MTRDLLSSSCRQAVQEPTSMVLAQNLSPVHLHLPTESWTHEWEHGKWTQQLLLSPAPCKQLCFCTGASEWVSSWHKWDRCPRLPQDEPPDYNGDTGLEQSCWEGGENDLRHPKYQTSHIINVFINVFMRPSPKPKNHTKTCETTGTLYS